MEDKTLRSVVSVSNKGLEPHLFGTIGDVDNFANQKYSPVKFDVRTMDPDTGGVIPELSGNFAFDDSFRNLIMDAIPAAAARKDATPQFIGRVFKGRNAADNLRQAGSERYATDSFDDALLDIMSFYDSAARKYPFDPKYMSSIDETPQRFIIDFKHALERGDIPDNVMHPQAFLDAKAIRDKLANDDTAEFLDATAPGFLHALALMENAHSGFTDSFLEDLRRGRRNSRIANALPAIEELVNSAIFNASRFTPGYSKNDVIRGRNASRSAYNTWRTNALLQKLYPGVDLEDAERFAKNIAVGKSSLLTNILNDSLDFTPLLGPELAELGYMDETGKLHYGDNAVDVWVPRRVGLWSPERRSTPHYERAHLPVYNFKSDWWKEYASGVERLSPFHRLRSVGMRPEQWGGADSYADYDGTTARLKTVGVLPLDYLKTALEHKDRGYYPNVNFNAMLGGNYKDVLAQLVAKEKSRRAGIRRANKREATRNIERRQVAEHIAANKTNSGSWAMQSDGAKNSSFKSVLKQIFGGKNDGYATLVANLGLDGYSYSDVMANEDLKAALRAGYFAMRDAGMPLQQVGEEMLKATARLKDNTDLSGIVSAISGRL